MSRGGVYFNAQYINYTAVFSQSAAANDAPPHARITSSVHHHTGVASGRSRGEGCGGHIFHRHAAIFAGEKYRQSLANCRNQKRSF